MNSKVLVVDDSRFNTILLSEILQTEGCTVHSVNNGLDALEIAHLFKPDIILLDIVMPKIDGFSVCSALKNDFELRDIPVIMVTAKTEGMNIKRALELGAFDYIKKPIDEIEVIARVQSALRFKQSQDILKEISMKDGLTGLYNHTLLIELFEKELAKHVRKRSNICFAMVDIDNFKIINDTYGHQSGDIILRELSGIMVRNVRKSDIVGRYGGEEFGIVLPEINSGNAYQLCQRMLHNIESFQFNLPGVTINITVSIGLYSKSPENSITLSDMIKNADVALYLAKKSGRNRVVMYPEENTYLENPDILMA